MSKDRTAKLLTVQEYKSLIFYQYSWICTEITNLNSMVGPFTPFFLQIKTNSRMNIVCSIKLITSVCTNSVFWLGLKQDIAVGSEMRCFFFKDFLSFVSICRER